MPVVELFATFSDHLKSPEAKMILRMKDVCSELGVSRASVYRLLQSLQGPPCFEAPHLPRHAIGSGRFVCLLGVGKASLDVFWRHIFGLASQRQSVCLGQSEHCLLLSFGRPH